VDEQLGAQFTCVNRAKTTQQVAKTVQALFTTTMLIPSTATSMYVKGATRTTTLSVKLVSLTITANITRLVQTVATATTKEATALSSRMRSDLTLCSVIYATVCHATQVLRLLTQV
jgi:hypothetical protein